MSLTSGWLPVTLQILALAVLAVAVGRRSREWLVRWIPIALLAGVVLAVVVRLFVKFQGFSQRAASFGSVAWVAVTGFAIAIAILSWRDTTWWRRTLSVLAVPLAVVCSLLALNTATGYFPRSSQPGSE